MNKKRDSERETEIAIFVIALFTSRLNLLMQWRLRYFNL